MVPHKQPGKRAPGAKEVGTRNSSLVNRRQNHFVVDYKLVNH